MNLKEITKELSIYEKKVLLKSLQYELKVSKFYDINDSSFIVTKLVCPGCGGSKIVNRGTSNDQIRYSCNTCKKTFNNNTGKAISGIKKTEKFQAFIKLVLESVSIRDASKELNLNVKTILDWRHKIASQLDEMNNSKSIKITNIESLN